MFLSTLKRPFRTFCVISHEVTAKKGTKQCDVRVPASEIVGPAKLREPDKEEKREETGERGRRLLTHWLTLTITLPSFSFFSCPASIFASSPLLESLEQATSRVDRNYITSMS